MDNQETNQEGLITKPSLFRLMTSDRKEAQFNAMVSRRNQLEIQTIASSMRSDLDFFTAIIATKTGIERTPRLFGISPEADGFFCDAISSRLVNIMTDRNAYYVAVRAMADIPNDQEKKSTLYNHTLKNFIAVACTRYGCTNISTVIAEAYDLEYKNRLFDMVAYNALFLSHEHYGNFVVQNVLGMNDPRTTYNVAVSLQERCVELSFKKSGSYIVEMLLEAKEDKILCMVVGELSRCEVNRFIRLATNEIGKYVVATALEVTDGTDMFWDLVGKLMPFRDIFRRSSHRNSIAYFLDSLQPHDTP